MQYISIINEFWRLNAIEPFNSTDTALYFYLLNQCNLRYWKNPFAITMLQIEDGLGVSQKTLIASRKRLEKRRIMTTIRQLYHPVILTLTCIRSDIG